MRRRVIKEQLSEAVTGQEVATISSYPSTVKPEHNVNPKDGKQRWYAAK
jgi:hypothetical protein